MSAVAATTARRKAYDALVSEYELDDPDSVLRPEAAEPERYALVQVSRLSGRAWITTHASKEDSAAYEADDEYPADWNHEDLVDLDEAEAAPVAKARVLIELDVEGNQTGDDILRIIDNLLDAGGIQDPIHEHAEDFDGVDLRITSASVRLTPDEVEVAQDPWEEDPTHSTSAWQTEVASDDTRLGYLAWVEAQREQSR